jgi:hypothetical protein
MPSCDNFGNVDGDGECRIGFLLTPTFSILPFISAVEPLRVANRFSGRVIYSWHVFSSDGEPVVAANGMAMAVDASIQEAASFPTVIVCGPHDPSHFQSPEIEAWLRRLARGGTRLGAHRCFQAPAGAIVSPLFCEHAGTLLHGVAPSARAPVPRANGHAGDRGGSCLWVRLAGAL